MPEGDVSSNTDWHMSKLHEVIISDWSKEEKLDAYATWSHAFDHDVLKQGYTSPEIVAAKVLSLTKGKALSVIDIGCGTGLLVPPLVSLAKQRGFDLNLVGLDFCQQMLDKARPKDLYSTLINADITEPLPVPENSFDFIISGGVFVAGHCGPEVIPNIVCCLKPGGYAVFTIRVQTFADAQKEYLAEFEKANCVLIENEVGHYLGPVNAHYAVLQKS